MIEQAASRTDPVSKDYGDISDRLQVQSRIQSVRYGDPRSQSGTEQAQFLLLIPLQGSFG